MSTRIAAFLLTFFLIGFLYAASAQTPDDIASEPHHDLLLQNDQVRVFAVTLQSTEKSFVNHEHNFLTISLQDCELVIWGKGQSPVQSFRLSKGSVRFSFGGAAVGFRNDQTATFYGLVVEFLNPKVTSFGYQPEVNGWTYGPAGINPPVDPHAKYSNKLELGAATVRDLQLLPGDTFSPPDEKSAELLIALTDLELKRESGDSIRKSAGEVLWISSEKRGSLVNDGHDPAHFIILELRDE